MDGDNVKDSDVGLVVFGNDDEESDFSDEWRKPRT